MYKTDAGAQVLDGESRLQRVSQAFSTPSWWYDMRGMFLVTFVYRSTIWAQVSFFERNLGTRHLEIPVGNGTVTSFALRLRKLKRKPMPCVVAVDCSDAMLAAAQKTFAKSDHVEVQFGDVARLEFEDGSFDSVTIANGFHCFPDAAAALDEIERVLRTGGTLAANILLHPRGIRPLRWIATKINAWAMRKGMLKAPFDADQAREMFRSRRFEITGDVVRGNTLYLSARKL